MNREEHSDGIQSLDLLSHPVTVTMEESGEESLDGSSIKPVSSLRSHFEQMANAKPTNVSGPKTVSPKGATNGIEGGMTNHMNNSIEQEAWVDGHGHTLKRGRRKEGAELEPIRTSSSFAGSATGVQPQRPTSSLPPAVNILPPQSPQKPTGLDLTVPPTTAYLSISSPICALGNSPRHFKNSSSPHTPTLEPGRSSILPVSQPPSLPPPRRSSELRRASIFKNIPPPVNRAEKPKIVNKSVSLSPRTEATALEPGYVPFLDEKSSPFNTPPSSESSPVDELPPPIPPNRPNTRRESISIIRKPSELPLHSSSLNRIDHELNEPVRERISSHFTGDPRPILPSRPQAQQESFQIRSTYINSMPPRPPRPPVAGTEVTPFATPPKRVFSNHSSQLHTPPRTHGRSMTIDRTTDGALSDFCHTPTTPGRQSLDSSLSSKDLSTPSLADYPDFSYSNRRPPYLKQGIRELATKYETRIMDVSGEYVCTSGHLTRVWNLQDGEVIASFAHTEGIKIISVLFKPTADIADEGSRIWLGNNVGELIEIDVFSQSLVGSKANAHARREIIKLYRHLDEIWSLDDGGTLHVWAADSSGSPSLTNPNQSFRLPKGHTFSMVVGHELWHATGNDIRLFIPTRDGSTQFQVLQRPLNQPNTGDITSGTTIGPQSDRVYFGHADGKVSIYSRKSFSCVGIINISMYKITAMAGVGGNIWASFSTGMIYVYDVGKLPWVVKKDWPAHQGPVIKLVSDPSSCWSLYRAQVMTLGQDNMLRVWDGLLEDDWIETHMQSQEVKFCELQSVRALVMTWNVGASTPFTLQQAENEALLFRDLIQSSGCPDILVFGFQELVDLEDKKTVTKSFFKSKKKDPSVQEHMSHQYRNWRDFLIRCLDDFMPRSELYHLLHTASLVGLFTCIFVRASLRERISNLSAAEVKRGLGGLHGNKGAIVIRFVVDDTSMCFINCHLAAGQSQTKDRNGDITAILEAPILPYERDPNVRQDSYIGGGDGTMILDHEICILNGDLNYRIDTMSRDTVVHAVKANNLSKLLERDQLLASKRKNPWFKLRAFQELPLSFAPTYKYDVGTDNYDTSEKKRSPAWCDRLLYRGRDRIQQLDYQRHEIRVSDHRPVTGNFEIIVKKISPKKRVLTWDDVHRQHLERKEKLMNEAMHDFLTTFIGYDSPTSNSLIHERKFR